MEYHVPSWAVVKTWRDENLLSLYVAYTCFDGFRRNKEIVPAERESKATETRARVEEKGLLDEIQYSRIFNRGFPRFVSEGMRRGACFASSFIKKQESSLLRIRGQRTFNFFSLFSPVPPLLLLSLLTRIIPVEDFSLPLSHPVPREQLPSSSFRLRTKRNPAPRCFFSLPPFPRYSREKRKERKKGRKERNTQ